MFVLLWVCGGWLGVLFCVFYVDGFCRLLHVVGFVCLVVVVVLGFVWAVVLDLGCLDVLILF